MPDSKVSDLAEATTYTTDDLMHMVNNPAGTPANVKITIANLFGGIPTDHINWATKTPATAAATGTAGDIAWDTGYIYVCTATNTWKRIAIATW